jgi:hypothetical protein
MVSTTVDLTQTSVSRDDFPGEWPPDDWSHVELSELLPYLTARNVRYYVLVERQRPAQAYFWAPEWQEGEREADEDIRLGRTRRFSTFEDAQAWLETQESEED